MSENVERPAGNTTTEDDSSVNEPRPLVTLHLPLDMHCCLKIMKAVARAYPEATIHDGEFWGIEK